MLDLKTNNQLINDYYDYLLILRNFSKKTAYSYSKVIVHFFRYLKNTYKIKDTIDNFSIELLYQIKPRHIEKYIYYLGEEEDVKVGTRNSHLCAIKGFYKYVGRYYDVSYNPAANIEYGKRKKTTPVYLPFEKAKKMIDVFTSENTTHPLRDNIMVTLFITVGLRLSELQGLNVNDIDYEECRIKVTGKGNKERLVYVPVELIDNILVYLKTREDVTWTNSERPLFLSQKNNRLTKEQIEKIINKAYELTGLKVKGISVHSLRHTAATILYVYSNGDLFAVRDMLGHSSVSTTEIYTHIDNDIKLKKYMENHPLIN